MKCPICQVYEFNANNGCDPDIIQGKCQCCGYINITKKASRLIDNCPEKKQKLMYHFGRNYIRGNEVACVGEEDISLILESVCFPKTVMAKIDEFVPFLGERSEFSGSLYELVPFDYEIEYPLIGCTSADEAKRICLWAKREKEFVRIRDKRPLEFELTFTGHSRWEKIRRGNRKSTKCFVAMPFSEDLNPLYKDYIRPSIEKAGYTPLRLDDHHYTGGIIDRMILEIRQCRFIVAEVSDANENVLYEIGYGLGYGKQVISLCRKGCEKELPFDIKQSNHIIWKDDDKKRTLDEPLTNRIKVLFPR